MQRLDRRELKLQSEVSSTSGSDNACSRKSETYLVDILKFMGLCLANYLLKLEYGRQKLLSKLSR